MEAQRPVGMSKAMLIADRSAPLNLVTSVRFDGVPDEARLARALRRTQVRHPNLKSRYTGLRQRPGSSLVELSVSRDSLRTTVERGLNHRFGLGEAPMLAELVDDGSVLVVTYRHATLDGVAAASLWGQILAQYASGARSGDPIDERFDPPPLDRASWPARLSFAARSMAADVRFRRPIGPGAPPYHRLGRTMATWIDFDEAGTHSVYESCRTHGVTLNAGIQGCVLAEVNATRHGGVPKTMRTVTFVDLRSRLDAKPTPDDVAPYFALLPVEVDVDSPRDPWEISRAFTRVLQKKASGAAPLAASNLAPMAMRMAVATRTRLANAAVSHTGPVPIDDHDGPLRVTELHAWVSNLPIGPELSVRSGLYQGRLTLDIMGLDTDWSRRDFEAVARRVGERLTTGALRPNP